MAKRYFALTLFLALTAFTGWAVTPGWAQAQRTNQPAPEIGGGPKTTWINGPPLTMAGLRGRVVLVEFWTYG